MTQPYYADEHVTLYHGDCREVLAEMPDASVEAVVTDPPYLLGFMGREWDTRAAHEHLDWHTAWCREAFRVAKPGGHLLAFGGTRTFHRLACAAEDAGFEIRDCIAWLYGSGFPKSLDVSKAIDKAAGAERQVIGESSKRGGPRDSRPADDTQSRDVAYRFADDLSVTAPATDAARQWQGWGTALKPAHEPIVVTRKPLAGTVAANVLQHGVGALNVDGCRVAHGADVDLTKEQRQTSDTAGFGSSGMKAGHVQPLYAAGGRWPANVVLDESQAAELDRRSGEQRDGVAVRHNGVAPGEIGPGGAKPVGTPDMGYGGSGGASRFFYTAKAPTDERIRLNGTAHPTVKPLDLMRWLVRLVTPPGGTVLDPFAGSGTTAEACLLEGFTCIAVEREADYLPLIVQRINRRRDPVAYVRTAGGDGGLFDLLGDPSP